MKVILSQGIVFGIATLFTMAFVTIVKFEGVKIVTALPKYIGYFLDNIKNWIDNNNYKHFIDSLKPENYINQGVRFITDFLSTIISNTQSVILFCVNTLIIIVSSFYFLKDWDKISPGIKSLLPKNIKKRYADFIEKLDVKARNLIKGQALVMLSNLIYYEIAFHVVGLRHAVFVAMITGVFSFIPYLGMFIGLILSIMIAVVQFKSVINIGIILVIFLVGNFVEGNILLPRFIGKKTGIHPLWIIFTILSGVQIAGIYGIIISIPIMILTSVFILEIKQKHASTKS